MRHRLREVSILSESEVIAILNTGSERDKLLIHLLYTTGLRVSEAVGLQWRDCRERVFKSGIRGGQLCIDGKGGYRRFVPVPPMMWLLIQRYHRPDMSRDDVLLPITSRTAERIVNRMCADVGIESRVTPHTFRHTHATHAANRGVPLHVIQSSLGHKNIATTAIYLHALPDEGSSLVLDFA